MVLPDVLVTRHELGARFDSVLEQLRRLEVPEVEQDVAVRLLLGLILQQEEPRDVIAEPEQLGHERLAPRREPEEGGRRQVDSSRRTRHGGGSRRALLAAGGEHGTISSEDAG